MTSAPETDGRTTYPKLPVKNWWELRRRFKQSMPKSVTADYLQSILGLANPVSAANLIPQLRTIGLVDDSNKPTELANRWRHDDDYASVCEHIRDRIYPEPLREAFPPPNPDIQGVRNWFARNTGTGQSAANAMSTFYVLLCIANPASPESRPGATTDKPTQRKGSTRVQTKPSAAPAESNGKTTLTGATGGATQAQIDRAPQVHIDIQIHIPASASLEQIDQIFASMGKHLYSRST